MTCNKLETIEIREPKLVNESLSIWVLFRRGRLSIAREIDFLNEIYEFFQKIGSLIKNYAKFLSMTPTFIISHF